MSQTKRKIGKGHATHGEFRAGSGVGKRAAVKSFSRGTLKPEDEKKLAALFTAPKAVSTKAVVRSARLKARKKKVIRSILATAVQTERVRLEDAEISRVELAGKMDQLLPTQRAAIEAARARAEALLRSPHMSVEALRERERAGAEWEMRHGAVKAFVGARRSR